MEIVTRGEFTGKRRGGKGRTGWIVGAALAVAALSFGVDEASAQSDEQEVLAVVQTLFDGMREKDEAKLRSVFHPTARLQNAASPDRITPIEQFIASVVGGGSYLDEVTFDEKVWVDGALAVAWTPYNLFSNEQFVHCGVDAFTMVRTDEGWKVVQLVDTRVQEGCDPSRRE